VTLAEFEDCYPFNVSPLGIRIDQSLRWPKKNSISVGQEANY